MSVTFILTSLVLLISLTLSSSQSLDLSNWMHIKSLIINNKTLKDLTIFGTHDSGAFNLSSIQMPGDTNELLEIMIYAAEELGLPIDIIINLWGNAHPSNSSFYNQLMNGVRYFDLRCGWLSIKQDWYAFHWTVGQTIHALCKEIQQFLITHTSEIVLIEASHLEGVNVNEKIGLLMNIFENIFGNLLVPRNLTKFPTYKEMIESGHRILLSLALNSNSTMDNHTNIWYGDTFKNTYANTANVNEMIEFNDKQVIIYNSETINALFKISWTLTPQTSTVIEMLLPSHPHSLLELAVIANERMFNWIEIQLNKNMSIGNVFLYDNYPTVDITDIINAIYITK